MPYKKIKTINSHAGLARFLAECEEDIIGYIERPRDIPSPYAYSPTVPVWKHQSGKLVFTRETRHKHYEVYEVPVNGLRTEIGETADGRFLVLQHKGESGEFEICDRTFATRDEALEYANNIV